MTGRHSLSSARCSVSVPHPFRQLFLPSLLAAARWPLLGSARMGQATTSVRGTVTDPDGNAVVGANVVLANAESKTERTATTGDQGEYQFLLIPPGTYTLTVTAAGFRGYEQKGLALLVNTPATANVQLKVGATTEVVTVTSEAPALESGRRFGRQFL